MAVRIRQDCFYSLTDKMVLLQIVAFIEIYEHARLDTRTLTVGEMSELERRPGNGRREDERQSRLEEKATCELPRYKQVNDFLFALRLFPHLSARAGPRRDGLELQSLTKQPW